MRKLFAGLKKAPAALAAMLIAVLFIAAAPKPEELKVILIPGHFAVGDAKVTGKEEWKIGTFKDALGSSREQIGYNKTHSYDDLGIVIFESLNDKNPSGKVSEVQVYFPGYPSNSVSPKNYFRGTVNLNGLKLNSSSQITPAKVRKKLKGWSESDSYMDHNFRFEKNGIYVYTQFNDADDAITKLSIGKAK